VPLEPQQADEGIAERGVSQMADVRRLVRIDGGVFDDDLRPEALCPQDRRAGQFADDERRARQEKLRYPFGALRRDRPFTGPSFAASSWAITRGALRNCRASSNATGTARSPGARRGGVSITMAG
jgi:hypothetical protein